MRPRKVLWTEGLFVTQHHFQQLDRYHEQLLSERVLAAFPHAWGVTELEIDERALAAGQLRVVRLVGIMPDGTPILVGDGLDDGIVPRPVDAAVTPQMKSLDVYIAIAQESDSGPNAEMEPGGPKLARFVRDQLPVIDYNLGVGEHTVPWARRNFRVLLGEERRDAQVTLRIAQIVRTSSGGLSLRDTFVPPSQRVRASPYLTSAFGRLLGIMAAKQRSLAETRRQRTELAVDFQATDAAKFWLLHLLNTHIPNVSHLVDDGTAHPREAYLMLSELIGALCTFAVEGDPTKIPRFNYLELGDVFAPMFERATKLLDAVIAEKYVQIPLNKREDGMYLGTFSDPTVLKSEFFLAASGNMSEGDAREKLPKLSKIASWNQINSILSSAVNGAKLELEYRPPGALPLRQGVVYFRLNRSPDFWNDIITTGTIAIYQPVDKDAVTLELYAVDPQNLK